VDGSLYYVHSDLPSTSLRAGLGSTVAVSDAAGGEVGRVQYDPYGEVLTSTLPADLTDRLFTSQRFDSSSGLYYYNARYYDPHLGRFIQPDSLVPDPLNPQAWNRFSYCGNNPTSYVDPSGHFPWVPLLVIGGAALLGGGYAWMRGYGPNTWQFYASAGAAAAVAGAGLLTGGYLAFAIDVGGGTLADVLIFGDEPGGAVVTNLAANLVFLGVGKAFRHLPYVRAFREGGILPWHARGFAAYADETGQVIAVRATNRRAALWNILGIMEAKPKGFPGRGSRWGIYRSGRWFVHSDYDLAAVIKDLELVSDEAVEDQIRAFNRAIGAFPFDKVRHPTHWTYRNAAGIGRPGSLFVFEPGGLMYSMSDWGFAQKYGLSWLSEWGAP
jgi:RHS repeat-associated protein